MPWRLPNRLQRCRIDKPSSLRLYGHPFSHNLPPLHPNGAENSVALVRCCRSASTARSSVKFSELPQGLLKADDDVPRPLPAKDKYPTVIQQAKDNMRRFENCVVLTRVGGFYELYFEQAEQYGPLLSLKVAAKSTREGAVPMSGFPFVQLDRYLKILVQDLGKYVAISEEFPNPKSKILPGELMYDRKVTRVITPGTLVDEKFMDPLANNFCLTLYVKLGSSNGGVQGHEASDGGVEAGTSAINKLRMANTEVGLAWVDLSTGEFFTQSSNFAELTSLLTRIGPKEIVLSTGIQQMEREVLLDILGPEQLLVTWQPDTSTELPIHVWQRMLESPIPDIKLNSFPELEIRAGSMLLQYVQERLRGSDTKLQPPVRRRDTENMIIDKHTLRGLEVLETMRESMVVGAKGSLLHAVRRTVTNSGARLLRDRITRPSAVLSVINTRLDLVEELLSRLELKETATKLLKKTFDTQRLVQKFALGRGDPDDLVSISRTINITQNILDALREDNSATALQKLCDRFSLEQPVALSSRIADAIDEEGLIASHEQEEAESSAVTSAAQNILVSQGAMDDLQALGTVARAKTHSPARNSGAETDEMQAETWIMRKDASETLSKLHDDLASLAVKKQELTEKMKRESGADTLTLRWTPGLGHICHVRKLKDVKLSVDRFPNARSASSSKTTRSFYVSDWTALGNQIDQTRMRIRAEEQRVFAELRDEVVRNLIRLRRNAAILDELDVACSSVALAVEQNAIRPSLDSKSGLKIVGGRHPTVTLGLEERGRPFVANDCFMNTRDVDGPVSDAAGGERIHLVTGPNMAGKSTFLRQNALFAIMAQVGLFVPAAFAHVGVVDALFARIGSADNLFSDESSFMTEMLETAHILRAATPRSLVVMDEVGRGTTPDDGLAVAFAALWHLAHRNRCRTLFATHFHALADLTAQWPPATIGRYCTDVREESAGGGADGDGFVYLHRVRPGVNRRSHALKVAGMAGLPPKAMEVAKDMLAGRKVEMQS